ncbi:Hypothetical predicted protein [Marmota monax]|uniref:Protein FAM64A n=1 Tax=Marmota monax TaxID=9995 RepID=A0A5E4ARS2_MARMO|nr:protein FAM64A [Marmota monax]VTJ59610.1 Hypothetical predicted protein [Marmota monax]
MDLHPIPSLWSVGIELGNVSLTYLLTSQGVTGRGDWTKQMASQWQNMGASVRRRSLLEEELPEEEVIRSAAGQPETSSGALGSLCRRFQRRLPLRAVSLNLRAGPSWKRLETPEPEKQGLQAAARSAKTALGAMSQRIQESCQSGTKWLVETQVKARRRKRGVQKDSSSPPPSLTQKNTRLSRAASDLQEREHHRLCARVDPRVHPRRRPRREAAFQSPYSSTEPLCSPRQARTQCWVGRKEKPQASNWSLMWLFLVISESDSDLEPVGAGIQHLQKLSQKLNKAIMAEESKGCKGSSVLQEMSPVWPPEPSHQDVCAMNFLEEAPRVISNPELLLTRT